LSPYLATKRLAFNLKTMSIPPHQRWGIDFHLIEPPCYVKFGLRKKRDPLDASKYLAVTRQIRIRLVVEAWDEH
jgi:hypothetical protein